MRIDNEAEQLLSDPLGSDAGGVLRGLSVGAEPGVPRDADVSVFVAVANLQACFSLGMVIAFPRQV